MSRSKYRILIEGHTHEGVERTKGEIVTANDRIADRYPNVFERALADSGEGAPESNAIVPTE